MSLALMSLQKKWVEAVDSSMLLLQSSISQKKRKGWNRNRRKSYQAKTAKSRLSKENKDVTVCLYYDERGLDRYFWFT